MKQHRFIGFGSPLDKHAAMKWLRSLGVQRIATRANTFRAQILAVQNHLGIAPLPKNAVRNAVEILPGIDAPARPLYFVSHPQSLRRPTVRAFADVLIEDLRKRLG